MQGTTVYSTPWFDLVAKRPATGGEPHYMVLPPDYVVVLAMTGARRLVLVRQYRPAIERVTIELPAGHVDGGETPEAAARRELLEETGYRAPLMEPLGCLTPDTGRMGNRMWCFFAADAEPPSTPHADEPGIEVLLYDEERLLQLVASGEFDHALHLAPLFLAARRGLFAAADQPF